MSISAISYICNGVKQWLIMDGKNSWAIRELPNSIGKSSVANHLNSLLKIKEITDENLYDWLGSHVPMSNVTTLNRKKYEKTAHI